MRQELTVLYGWAPKLGAAIVQLEHRFFGVSNPSTDSNVTIRYKSLNLDNVLDDSVTMLQYVKKTHPRLTNARVIAHGGMLGDIVSVASLTPHQAPMAAF